MPKAFPFLTCLLAVSLCTSAVAAPTISSITASKIVTEGSDHTIVVAAAGLGTPNTQWYKDGTPITAGKDSFGLYFPAITPDQIGRYYVVVTDSTGSTTSPVTMVDVSPASPPYFSNSSSDTSFTVGQSLSLYRSYSGTTPMTFQWNRDGIAIPGATDSNYNVNYAAASEAGVYTLTATNFKGTATSQPITVRAVFPTAPSIYSQPNSVVVREGSSTDLSVSYNSSGSTTLELLRYGTVVQTSTYRFSLSNVTSADAGEYRIRISNAQGSVTTEPFNVYVEPAAPIQFSINGPSNAVKVGDSFSINSNTSSSPGLSFQWFKNGAPVSNATSYYFSKYSVSLDDAGSYYLEITQAGIVSRSNSVAVSVRGGSEFFIVNHPASLTYSAGDYQNLSVSLSKSGNFTYSWSRNGEVLLSQDSSQINLRNYDATTVYGSYVVTISDGSTTLSSLPAVVSPYPAYAPIITRQPESRTINFGSSLSLAVEASGHPTPTYQWFKDGVPIPNSTSYSLYLSNVDSTANGAYQVKVTNSSGTVSSTPTNISVQNASISAPLITRHPDSYNVLPGSNTSLYVNLLSTSTSPSYQWFKDDVLLPGETQSQLRLSGEPHNDGNYHVVVTNSQGSVTSEPASFKVYLTSELPPIIQSSGSRASNATSSASFSLGFRSGIQSPPVVWRKDGEIIPQEISQSIYISSTSANTGLYTAEVTMSGQKFTTNPMRLSSIPASTTTVIESQPTAITMFAGTDQNLQIYASNVKSYQWYKDDQLVPLATNSSLSLRQATAETAGSYHVVLTGLQGNTLTSDPITVTVIPSRLPVITQHPLSLTLSASSSSYYSLGFSYQSTGYTTFQWFRDSVALPGQTNTSLNLNSLPSGIYQVTVTNSAGSVTSLPATLDRRSETSLPTISRHPQSVSGRIGAFVSLSVVGSGGSGLAYQWYHHNVPISGANGSQHTIAEAQLADAGVYSVTLTNEAGRISSLPAFLTIAPNSAPVITLHPTSRTIDAGLATTFTAAAEGFPSPTYQWRRNGADIFGATQASLTLTNVQANQSGTYTLLATNSEGSALSQPAQLSLTQAGLPIAGRHHVEGNGYTPNEPVTIAVRLSFATDIASLGYQVLLPEDWTYVSSTATNTVTQPLTDDQSLLEWTWADLPSSPMDFTFTLMAPSTPTGPQEFVAMVVARRANADYEALVNPDPLLVDPAATHHTADLNRDGKINLSELLRLIELYNTRNQSTRTGRYTVGTDTPDGFTTDPTQPASVDLALTRYHLADTNRDGRINLSELLRIIELYNTRAGSTRTGSYHRAANTVDGFAPGSGE